MTTISNDEKRAIRRNVINSYMQENHKKSRGWNLSDIKSKVRTWEKHACGGELSLFDTIEPEDDDEPEEVELIASGYEWICPRCDELNKTIEVTERVTCKNCGHSYSVQDYHHAIG